MFGPANGIAAGTAGTNTIAGCGSFVAPAPGVAYTPVPINYCVGPTLFTLNLRATKTFGFGPRTGPPVVSGSGGGPGGPGAPGGDHRGGGGNRGGGGGGTGKRYNLGFGLIMQNIFANRDVSNPNGTLNSPLFGQSTQLAGGPYSGNAALRRIAVSMSFSF